MKLLKCFPWARSNKRRRRPMKFARSGPPLTGGWSWGGRVHGRPMSDDNVPVFLSPGRSTALRPGETHLEAMERLMDGTDL